jgi:hypothetical protein
MILQPKSIASFFAAVLFATAAQATITIELDAGHLYTTATTSAGYVNVGGLLQVLVSTNGSFAAPSLGSYTDFSPSTFVLANLAMNDTKTDETDNTFQFSLGGNVAQGESLMLRWFPSITLLQEQSGATPLLGTTYGQFEGSSADLYPGDSTSIPWTIPADGSNSDLYFLTVASGGTHAETVALANQTVSAIPEPATTSLLAGAVALGAMIWRRRK